MSKTFKQLDGWREAFVRADSAGPKPEDGDLTKPFAELRGEFLRWFSEVARIAEAVADPFADGAAAALVSLDYEILTDLDLEGVVGDLVDTGHALTVRGDPDQLKMVQQVRRALIAQAAAALRAPDGAQEDQPAPAARWN